MLLIAPLLLLLPALAICQSQKQISWTQELPSGWLFNKGDRLRIPLDEYTNLSSAIFEASDPTKNRIWPKLNVTLQAKSMGGNDMVSCSIAKIDASFAYYVCNQNFLRITKDDNFLTEHDTVHRTTLTAEGLTPSQTFCTDYLDENESILINCYQQGTTLNKNFIFSGNPKTFQNNDKFYATSCESGEYAQGDSKMVRVTTADKRPAVFFYNPARTTNQASGVINLLYCDLKIGADASPTSNVKPFNLYTELGNLEELNKGFLKYIYSVSSSEILVFIAIDDNQTNKLYIISMDIGIDGKITKSASNKQHYIWTGANIQGFNARYMTITAISPSEYLASDKTNLYKLKISTANNKVELAEPVWYSVVNCGASNDESVYVSSIRITDSMKNLDDINSRTIITFSDKNSFKMKEFAVHFNGTRYGCSRSTKAMDSTKLSNPNTVRFNDISLDTLIVSEDKTLSKVKLNFNTILEVAIPSETASQEVKIAVKMDSYAAPDPKTLAYKTLKNALDTNTIDFKMSKFRAYKDTKFALPILPESFQTNNPTISTPNNQNVKTRYAMSIKPTFDFDLTSYTKITRIFAIDEDSFLAVVSKNPNEPEGFIRFWAKWNGDTLSPFQTSGGVTPLKKYQVVFKTFKLGSDIFCLVFKGSGTDSSKLSLSCYEDKVNGNLLNEANDLVISNNYEITDIQIMESANRADFFMIGIKSSVKDTKLLYYYIDLDSNGKIKTQSPPMSAEEINISKDDLSNYYPTDLMLDFFGDDYSGCYITIKMISKYGQPPLITKFSVNSAASTIPKLTFAYSDRLPSNDVAFCGIKNEIIYYTPKKKEILIHKMVRGKSGITLPQNDLFLPLAEFGIKFIQQFNCVPEKGLFQVLAMKDVNKKVLITFRAGDSTNAARRVHSVVEVADQASFIESASAADYVLTIANTEGDNKKERNFIYIYHDGPHFLVDNNGKNENYDIGITATNSVQQAQSSFTVEVISPKLKAELSPKKKFEIEVGKTIMLDEVANIQGPVMDIKVEGSDADKVKVIKRNNKNKGFAAGGEATSPERMYVESDFMVLVWEGKKVKIYGDPAMSKKADVNAPEEIDTIPTNVREVGLVKFGSSGIEAVMVLRSYDETGYSYSLYHLSRVADSSTPLGFKYNAAKSLNLFKTNMDFDSLQIIAVSNEDVVVAMKMKRAFNSNYIKLVAFKRGTGNIYTKGAETMVSTDGMHNLGGHSLTTDNNGNAYLVSHYKNVPGLLLAKWSLTNAPVYFTQSKTKFKFSDSESFMLNVNKVRCWPKTGGIFECYVDSDGVVDYMFDLIPDKNAVPGAEPIESLTKTMEFEMPPNFDIHRIDRGKEHLGFLMKKSKYYSASTRRLLQGSTIDKFTDCDNLILIYKPAVSRFIYTGITCSEWGNNPLLDFSMEYDTKEYVFFTRSPAPKTSRILQSGAEDRVTSNFISPILVTINANVDPKNVKFSFVGLGGQGDTGNTPALTLNDFKEGEKPVEPPQPKGSSFWTWFIIILVILLIIGGGVYAFIWYKNNNSADTSVYTKTDNRDSSRTDDLEDTRL